MSANAYVDFFYKTNSEACGVLNCFDLVTVTVLNRSDGGLVRSEDKANGT